VTPKSPKDDKPSGNPLDDLPYAEEEPSTQSAAPSSRPDGPDESGAKGKGKTGKAKRPVAAVPDLEPDPEETAADLSDEALEEAALLVQNDLAALTRERDDYLENLRRVQAEFENYRKRVMAQQADQAERAAEGLVGDLLPVLDACDGALQHGADGVEPIFGQLLDTLTKSGLERLDPDGEPFDPNFHEAVMHEEGDGSDAVVVEVLRPGYTWKGRVLRPAMVKVKG
jgi:molecular chaperone GrpE